MNTHGNAAYAAKCEVGGPIIGAFEVVEPAAEAGTSAAVRFAPERLGHVDRQRQAAMRDLADAEARRDRLIAEQDRIIRELSETDATIFFLRRTIQSADAVCDRG